MNPPDAVKVNPLSPLKLSAPPPPPKPLAFLPKRLLLMQGIKTQADLINAVRDDFVDKASKQRTHTTHPLTRIWQSRAYTHPASAGTRERTVIPTESLCCATHV